MPATSSFNSHHKQIFEKKELVEFKQADLSKDPHVQKVFALYKYDYIFNLCGETRCGLSEEEYKAKCTLPVEKCSAASVAQGSLKRWVEISSAAVYQSDDKPSNEEAKTKPWTIQAKYRLDAENYLRQLTDFPLVVLRPSIVYGVADLTGITPRIACAAVYKQKKEKMKLLWDKSLKCHVVHVSDLVRAMWLVATDSNIKSKSVYNVSEPTNVDQGVLNQYLGNIFKIETGFLGSITSNLAKLALSSVADSANDEHVPTWTTLCTQHHLNTPVSPYIDKELLSNNHMAVDGTKITKDLAKFTYQKSFSEATLKEQIDSFIQQGLFPPIL
jgi:nucleoside-diphosphate-sugar epimerase